VNQRTSTRTLTLEIELSCRECGVIVVDIFEVEGVQDGRGYVSCYECGEITEIEVE
jgi:transcription elongation factor Elf1